VVQISIKLSFFVHLSQEAMLSAALFLSSRWRQRKRDAQYYFLRLSANSADIHSFSLHSKHTTNVSA
jgi:hypothetical protein